MGAAYGGPRTARRYYFRCVKKCGAPYIRVRHAEDACETTLWYQLEALGDELSRPPAPVKVKPASDVRERKAKLEAKRAKALDLHTDGLTTREELRLQLAKIDVERMRLEALEVGAPVPTPEDRLEELRFVGMAMRAWLSLPPRDRRQVVNCLAVSIGLTLDGDEVHPSPTWRAAAEVDLSEVADLLAKYIPTKERQRASAEFIEKLRQN
jgi:hypothetical protein